MQVEASTAHLAASALGMKLPLPPPPFPSPGHGLAATGVDLPLLFREGRVVSVWTPSRWEARPRLPPGVGLGVRFPQAVISKKMGELLGSSLN